MFSGLFDYYGLDWAALVLGLMGCYFITHQRRQGFLFSIVGCVCGLAVAALSNQYGFIIYNIVLIVMMTRGYAFWSSKEQQTEAALGAE